MSGKTKTLIINNLFTRIYNSKKNKTIDKLIYKLSFVMISISLLAAFLSPSGFGSFFANF